MRDWTSQVWQNLRPVYAIHAVRPNGRLHKLVRFAVLSMWIDSAMVNRCRSHHCQPFRLSSIAPRVLAFATTTKRSSRHNFVFENRDPNPCPISASEEFLLTIGTFWGAPKFRACAPQKVPFTRS